jgi:phosphoribosylcarboxyaminoimidazole (NCAIR) mutase
MGRRLRATPLVGIIMGGTSDGETMQHAATRLEARVVLRRN